MVLPELIEVRIPSKDRQGRPIPAKKKNKWIRLWQAFLLSPAGMSGEGYEAVAKLGTWRKGPKASFDPQAGEFPYIEEEIRGIRMYCSRRQLQLFLKSGRALLIRMGRQLNQEAVAYETRRGLHVIRLRR